MEILLLLLSIILTPVLINYSKLRSIKQPIYFSYQSELILISHVLKHTSFLLEIKERSTRGSQRPDGLSGSDDVVSLW